MKTVLSIDGGGIKGVIPAYVIKHLESELGAPISDFFDLIVGSSTGGIIACGCAYGFHNNKHFTASDILSFYKNESREIFHNPKNIFSRVLTAKYSNNDLENELRKKFDDDHMRTMTTKVMVPAYDIVTRQPFFFRSWNNPTARVPIYKAVAAGASAPVFFEPTLIEFKREKQQRLFIDGSVVASNPALCAYIEAKKLWSNEEIFVVSIGTGNVTSGINFNRKKWGFKDWMGGFFDIVMQGPVSTVDHQMRELNPDFYVRLQANLYNSSERLDNVSKNNIKNLIRDAKLLIKEQQDDIDYVINSLKSCGEEEKWVV